MRSQQVVSDRGDCRDMPIVGREIHTATQPAPTKRCGRHLVQELFLTKFLESLLHATRNQEWAQAVTIVGRRVATHHRAHAVPNLTILTTITTGK
ncbi:hypothetical protein HGRIS_014837 [Hohenbuehelia grisea]|uniref:Uncharacterized protein n=1 Tax=Hohenbuehelia grisea TaxID=104357 RepID=A0ABR3IQY7_9AGAR